MKDNKKIIVSSVFVVLLLLLVVGITYAVFNFVNNASENTISTGSITMSYSEPSNALELINALPMSDEEGEKQTNYFEFNVSSNASTNTNDNTGVTIPYEVNISDLQVNEGMLVLPKNAIKISLVKVEGATEVQVIEKPTLLSNMSASSLRENATKIYNTENVHKNGNGAITTTYRLRAWIDENYAVNKDSQEQYKFSVNVNSLLSPLEAEPTLNEMIMNQGIVTTGNGLYMTKETNSGNPSYYYHGNVDNNYVKLDEDKDGVADTLYRIVRINEDGSIRLIRQDGIDNNTTYKFNSISNKYTYMYYSSLNGGEGIMKRVSDWYSNTFGDTKLDTKIVASEFCEQAKVVYSGHTKGNASALISSPSYDANLKCVVDGNGKGILNIKAGLINVDEMVLAGVPLGYEGITASEYNVNTYLQTEFYFWTMSPCGFYNGANAAFAWDFDPSGYIGGHMVDSLSVTVRPVISLSSDITATGDGSETSPFELIFD